MKRCDRGRRCACGAETRIMETAASCSAFVPGATVETGFKATSRDGVALSRCPGVCARSMGTGVASARAQRSSRAVVLCMAMKKQPDGKWSSDDEGETSASDTSDAELSEAEKAAGSMEKGTRRAGESLKEGTEEARDALQDGAVEARASVEEGFSEARSSLETGASDARSSLEEGAEKVQSEMEKRASALKSRLDSEFPPKDPGMSAGEKASKKEELRSASADVLKTRLVTLAAASNRGQSASVTQRDLIEVLAKRLEELNPNPDPVDMPMIDGVWDLIYSSTQLYKTSPFLLGAATPLVQVGLVRQTIFVDSGEAINEVSVTSFPAISGRVITTMRIAPVSGKRLECKVEKTELKGGSIAGRLDIGMLDVDIPVQQVVERLNGTVPETFFDTVYLDDLMRISRSKNGALYIFVKEGK
ncbi:Light-induced protein, chloroplastic [Porphyridium purpureum]|uniref:Light-induced protein, chloroplastic n=1 Tax=Porphyridium purpureum TaxID=35688 RepID=A0A5J4Z5Z5_PORPP|nr:Light-induced protein, chloroplastic [Porphyridium purpureum]|eukprot:POR9441..scf295_1